MTTSATRDKLEARIVDKSLEIPVSDSSTEWIKSEEFEAFMSCWPDLVKYHAAHADPVMGIEVVREYLDLSRILREIMIGKKSTPMEIEQAKEAIVGLEYWLEEVIAMAVSNLDESTD